MQPLAEAHLAPCTACAEKIARVWPLIPNDFDFDFDFDCVSLLLVSCNALGWNLNLARVCRNLNSWGCTLWCAMPNGMMTDAQVLVSVGDAEKCSRPQNCKCV